MGLGCSTLLLSYYRLHLRASSIHSRREARNTQLVARGITHYLGFYLLARTCRGRRSVALSLESCSELGGYPLEAKDAMGRIVGSLDGNWNGNGTWESGLGWVDG
jgi:hypothetical protein